MNKIVILGGGISGIGSGILAKKNGFEVFLSDKGEIKVQNKKILEKHNILFEELRHTEEKILNTDLIIKSPGIHNKNELITEAQKRNIPVISEIEFAYRYTKGFIIAITGSNGKTTTSSLIYHILKNSGFEVSLCGNIGESFALQVATYDTKYYVIEISSQQLENITSFRPNISIITNLSPDHLDWYDNSYEKYSLAKLNITNYQTKEDILIFNEDDKYLCNLVKNKNIISRKMGFSINNDINFNKDKLQIKGIHNIYNSICAYIIGKNLKIKDEEIEKHLYSFKPVEHRLEFIKNVNGVDYINDSKATNVDSAFYALQAMEKDIIWIAGGKDKGNDYSVLDIFLPKIKGLICLGVDNNKLIKYYTGKIPIIQEAKSMQEAIEKSNTIAKKNQVILLSPCCASFDLFKNYEDRGNQFKNIIGKL